MIGALFFIVLLGVAYIEAYCFRALIKALGRHVRRRRAR